MKIRYVTLIIISLLVTGLSQPVHASALYNCADYLSAIISLQKRAREAFRDGFTLLADQYEAEANKLESIYSPACSGSSYRSNDGQETQTSLISDDHHFKLTITEGGNITYQNDDPKYRYSGWVNVEAMTSNYISGTWQDA